MIPKEAATATVTSPHSGPGEASALLWPLHCISSPSQQKQGLYPSNQCFSTQLLHPPGHELPTSRPSGKAESSSRAIISKDRNRAAQQLLSQPAAHVPFSVCLLKGKPLHTARGCSLARPGACCVLWRCPSDPRSTRSAQPWPATHSLQSPASEAPSL